MAEIDRGLGRGETEQKPLLDLAQTTRPNPRHSRQLVGEPFRVIRHQLDLIAGEAELFFELAVGGGFRLFAAVDPALRHLPAFGAGRPALDREHLAAVVDDRDTDVGSKVRILSHFVYPAALTRTLVARGAASPCSLASDSRLPALRNSSAVGIGKVARRSGREVIDAHSLTNAMAPAPGGR